MAGENGLLLAAGAGVFIVQFSLDSVQFDNLVKQRDRQTGPVRFCDAWCWTGCCNFVYLEFLVSLSILCTDNVEPGGMKKMKWKSSVSLMMDTGQGWDSVSLMVTTDGANCLPTNRGIYLPAFIFRIITPRLDGRNGWIMIFTETNILTDKELKKLKEHVYSSSCASLLDPLMQKYWNWWELFPLDSDFERRIAGSWL